MHYVYAFFSSNGIGSDGVRYGCVLVSYSDTIKHVLYYRIILYFFGHTYALVKMVTLDEEILKCMMDQNLFVIYEDLYLINVHEYKKKKLCKENMELKKSLEFLQNHMHELKTEVA